MSRQIQSPLWILSVVEVEVGRLRLLKVRNGTYMYCFNCFFLLAKAFVTSLAHNNASSFILKSQNLKTFQPSFLNFLLTLLSRAILSSIFLYQKLFLTFIFFFSFDQLKPCQNEESQNTAIFCRFQQKSGVPSTPFRLFRYPRKPEAQSVLPMIFSISVPFALTRDIL